MDKQLIVLHVSLNRFLLDILICFHQFYPLLILVHQQSFSLDPTGGVAQWSGCFNSQPGHAPNDFNFMRNGLINTKIYLENGTFGLKKFEFTRLNKN